MDCVLDASIALAWALPDETSLQADQFLTRVSGKDVLMLVLGGVGPRQLIDLMSEYSGKGADFRLRMAFLGLKVGV